MMEEQHRGKSYGVSIEQHWQKINRAIKQHVIR